jgi:hypothetical protein
MSKPDAERALNIYRTFTRQTDFVVQYLTVARQYEHHTRVEVPKLKHAPVNLGRQLEDYVKDQDFEIHRRQYLAEEEAKKSKGGPSGSSKMAGILASKSDTSKAFANLNGSSGAAAMGQQAQPAAAGPSKAAETNLIDFFESIEQNQTPMATQPPPGTAAAMAMSPWTSPFPAQMQTPASTFPSNGFVSQPTGFQAASPFSQSSVGTFSPQTSPPQALQPNFTGAGFGGFTPQPQPQAMSSFQPGSLGSIPQNSVASFQTGAPVGFASMQQQQQASANPLQAQQTGTNPFRQSLVGQPTGMGVGGMAMPTLQQRPSTSQSTNPFTRTTAPAAPAFTSPIAVQNTASPFQSQPPQAAPLMPMATGTNPFAKNYAQPVRPVTAGGLMPQATGTNPFRQSTLNGNATGLGFQTNQPIIGGGLDQLQTIPVFPRTAGQTPWQQ